MKKEMCFYITKEFQENPPEPVDEEVYIKKSEERVVFVKQFGGYAMRDKVWMGEAEKFWYVYIITNVQKYNLHCNHCNDYREELTPRHEELVENYFFTAGYDSPMKFWNRRNEVAFEKINNEVDI